MFFCYFWTHTYSIKFGDNNKETTLKVDKLFGFEEKHFQFYMSFTLP